MGGLPRVLHIGTELTWRGGEQQAWLLMAGLANAGAPQALLAPARGELAVRSAAIPNLRVFELPTGSRMHPANWLALRRAIAAFRPQVIHAHTSHAHALAWMAAPRHLPIVATRRVDFPLKTGRWSRRRYLSRRVHMVAISSAIHQILASAGCPPERLHLVHSGIDASRFADFQNAEARQEARQALLAELCGQAGSTSTEPLLVGNVAALTDHKGQIYLIEALGKLASVANSSARPVLAVIAGDGELRETLEAEARRLGLLSPGASPRLEFLGYRRDVPSIMAALDVFVMPSHMEGLGTSVVDAMCMGLPVVASAAGGIPELIRHEHNGLLVPARDPVALAVALDRMLTDPACRSRLASQARRDFLNGPHRSEAMVAGNLQVYRHILAGCPARG